MGHVCSICSQRGLTVMSRLCGSVKPAGLLIRQIFITLMMYLTCFYITCQFNQKQLRAELILSNSYRVSFHQLVFMCVFNLCIKRNVKYCKMLG